MFIRLGSTEPGPVIRQNIIVTGCSRSYSPHDRQEITQNKDRRLIILFVPSPTYLLQ